MVKTRKTSPTFQHLAALLTRAHWNHSKMGDMCFCYDQLNNQSLFFLLEVDIFNSLQQEPKHRKKYLISLFMWIFSNFCLASQSVSIEIEKSVLKYWKVAKLCLKVQPARERFIRPFAWAREDIQLDTIFQSFNYT